MPGADPAEYAIRLNAWLTGRQANVHPEISTTQVRAVPLDRASSAYTIAESDVAAALARAVELETENARLREELEAARIRLDLLALPVTANGLRALLSVVEQRAAPDPELTDRQAALLTAIRREGGDWSPLRARAALMSAGYAVLSNRAAQIMKGLAAHGLLEPIRPRAFTYRLVTPPSAVRTDEISGGHDA